MDIKLSCNHINYYLSRDYLSEFDQKRCEECGGIISGKAFTCQRCYVCLHASCVDKLLHVLPREIMHPFHLHHQLQLYSNFRDFICDRCMYISVGYRYRCSSCNFNLDVACASSLNDHLPKDQELLILKDQKKMTILHYSHGHSLSIFKYKKIHEEHYYCFWCEKRLSEVCWGCTECKFYLHSVCRDKIPRRLSHPSHPGHPLRLRYITGFHLRCVVPSSAEHRYHRHPLLLVEWIIEDDSEEYFYDVCEKVRNPKSKALAVSEIEHNEETNAIRTLIQPIFHSHQMYEVTEEFKGNKFCYGCRLVEDNMVEIRKNCPQQNLQKKRHDRLQAQPIPSALHYAIEKKLENFPAMVAGVWTDDRNLQLEASTQFKSLLSVIQAGVIPRFVELLTRDDFPHLQSAVVNALAIISGGTSENRKVLIDHGAVSVLVKLLDSPNDDIRQMASFSLLRHASFTLSALFCVLPLPPFDQMTKKSWLRYAMLSISFLTSHMTKPKLFLKQVHPSPIVFTPCLVTVANIFAVDDMSTQSIFEANTIVRLVDLLQNDNDTVKGAAARAIRHATCRGTSDQIKCLVSQGCIKLLCDLLICPDPNIVNDYLVAIVRILVA
ncbi:hypothetical protein V6N11_079402 [Hibiscus sabdariffa]|uniref:Phorbol-ester/DAG-type domain-containing protein n=1 Tax=Hibiscus sabdariffa TaxID=183260 RepID=A0ABR2RVM8_9ROSI